MAGDDARQAELVGFYRDDEAAAFTAHAWPVDAPTVALIQMLALGGRPPVRRTSTRLRGCAAVAGPVGPGS